MAESQHDNWADALSKLAGGDVAPSEHEHEAPIEPPVTPISKRATTPRTPPPRTVAPPIDATPVRPQRPAAPSLRPMAPSARVPSPPTSTLDELIVPAIDDQPIVMDDDSVIMDAPDASVFAPKRIVKTAKRVDRAALYRTIGYRQTLIPVLLTCGVLLLMFSILRLILGPDSALADLPGWLPAVLAITGAVLLAFAGLNMVSVKSELAEREAIRAAK